MLMILYGKMSGRTKNFPLKNSSPVTRQQRSTLVMFNLQSPFKNMKVRTHFIIFAIFFIFTRFECRNLVKTKQNSSTVETKINHGLLQALEGVKLRLEKVLCECSPKYCSFITCNVKALSRQIATLNLAGLLTKTVSNPKYNTESFYQFSNNEYRPVYLHTSDDYCKNEAGTSKSPLHDLLKAALANYTNLFRSCPFVPAKYYLKGFNFDASHLPNVIPVGRYAMKTSVYERNETIGNVTVYFQVHNYGILDLSMGQFDTEMVTV